MASTICVCTRIRKGTSGKQLARLHPAAGDKPNYDHDHDDHQNNVNQGTAHMERESKKPQYEQDYRDSPKHLDGFKVARELRQIPCSEHIYGGFDWLWHP
jgi:hypothetical protein